MFIKLRDIILIIIFLLTGVGLLIAYRVTAKDGAYVVIYTENNTETARWSIDADCSDTFVTDYGTNVVAVKDGSAYVESADCENCTCVKMGKISKTGESIICAPHKLIVRIEGANGEAEIDGVS